MIRYLFLLAVLSNATLSFAQELREEVIAGAHYLFNFKLQVETPFMIVSYEENKLFLMKFDSQKNIQILKEYTVSNGRGGISNVVKSGGTPPGVHVMYRKQGHDYALGQSFDASKYGYNEMIMTPTQGLEFWPSDFVLTRIMRLQGLEGAKNNNSVQRSILIHGTGPEGLLGYHESLGCVRMRNHEVIELFDLVNEGILVNIVYLTGDRKRVPADQKIILDEKRYLRETGRPIKSSRKPASEVNLMGGGDILYHGGLIKQAVADGFGFEVFYEDVRPIMKQADWMYANLEGPIAYQVNTSGRVDPSKGFGYVPEENIYSSIDETNLSFNFHPKAADALVNVGISIVSTANNHTFDRKFLGIDKTIEKLEEVKLPYFGSKSSKNLSAPWYSINTVNGIRLGFIGCTYGIQGAGPKDSEQAFKQVMFCFQGSEPNAQLIREIKALAPQVDIVVFTPHWGGEYAPQPNASQKKLAHEAINAGARVVLGSHPHVLQPTEIVRQGNEIKAVIAYSLGNFVTNQMSTDWRDQTKQVAQFPTRVSGLLGLKIKKEGDKVMVSKPLWVPTYMPPKNLIGGQRRKLLLAYPELYTSNTYLKNQVSEGRNIMSRYLGPDAQILTLEQTNNIFSNIQW